MLSLDDFRALEETGYLLGNAANATRLLSALGQLAGETVAAREVGR